MALRPLAMAVAVAALFACSSCSSSSHGDPDPRDATTGEAQEADAADASSDADAPPACGPADVSAFVPVWDPPVGPDEGACTDAQLAGLITACFAAFATSANCTAWEDEPANLGCLGCWSGPETASRWAPYLYVNNPGETDYLNIAGCVALADPSNLVCAESLQAALQCEFAACLGPCPVPNNATPDQTAAAEQALTSCYDRSDKGGCEALVNAASACAEGLEDGGPAAFCFRAGQQTSALNQFFTLACGGVVLDGGKD